MTKMKRRALIGVGSVFGVTILLIAGLAIFLSTLDRDQVKKSLSAAVSAATGRELTISGDLDWDIGWTSKISASQILFQNASWSKQPHISEIRRRKTESKQTKNRTRQPRAVSL